jgi:hypothetical protein
MSLFPHLSFAPYFDICKTQQNKNICSRVVKQEWHLSKNTQKWATWELGSYEHNELGND